MNAMGSVVRRVTARLRTPLRQIGDADAQAGTAIVEYAVSAASREAGRAYVTAEVAEQAPVRARSAAGLAFADQGFEHEGTIEIECEVPCLRPERRVQVKATISVPMPLVPAFFSEIVPMRIPVSATHVATVERFGGQ